jgi:diadenosine tetraphosphate (Ap4A) HIT family hydrolase
MSEHEGCLACAVTAGRHPVPGGLVHRESGFALHALADPSPLRGWLVLTSERHVRAWPDLAPDALVAIGPLAARVMSAQRSVLGAEHVYVFSIGDAVRHFHLHLVPRYSDTPGRLWGRRCFEGTPADAIPEQEAAAAAQAVASALRRGAP